MSERQLSKTILQDDMYRPRQRRRNQIDKIRLKFAQNQGKDVPESQIQERKSQNQAEFNQFKTLTLKKFDQQHNRRIKTSHRNISIRESSKNSTPILPTGQQTDKEVQDILNGLNDEDLVVKTNHQRNKTEIQIDTSYNRPNERYNKQDIAHNFVNEGNRKSSNKLMMTTTDNQYSSNNVSRNQKVFMSQPSTSARISISKIADRVPMAANRVQILAKEKKARLMSGQIVLRSNRVPVSNGPCEVDHGQPGDMSP